MAKPWGSKTLYVFWAPPKNQLRFWTLANLWNLCAVELIGGVEVRQGNGQEEEAQEARGAKRARRHLRPVDFERARAAGGGC